ncbi:hypothetical protein CAL14_00985 [Bordetella genomosp. 9]|uniref:hypothetical protein n=1 Tax=Bordetella genomosp. 9 TaxID=1416803 RepID=UPI000A294808|nr:hypothetical protein [Bordetella genomosp. 9]ARP89044.1 hypothetical protein CAL14_00985 [Bordetella genomosp. 9]
MQVSGHGNTPPGSPPAAARTPGNAGAPLLGASVNSPPRAALARRDELPSRNTRPRLLRFFSGGPRRAAARALRAQEKLQASLERFVDRQSMRRIDDLTPKEGARLLKAVCGDIRQFETRARASLAAGGAASPARDACGGAPLPTLDAVLAQCLGRLDASQLHLLYDDLASQPDISRDLIRRQEKALRPVAADFLDTMEQALVRELATRGGRALLDTLLEAAAGAKADPHTLDEALDQLYGIGLSLTSPCRTPAHVLSLMLDSLTDDELGVLAAQAWPDASIGDAHRPPGLLKGAPPGERCEDDARSSAASGNSRLDEAGREIWRQALRAQLREREDRIAVQTVHGAGRNGGVGGGGRAITLGRMMQDIRDIYAGIDARVHALAGRLPTVTELHMRLRYEVLAIMLHHLPLPQRRTSLLALPVSELSSLRTHLDVAPDMSPLRPTVGAALEAVCDEMLHAVHQRTEDALAAVYEAIAREDRPAAAFRLVALAEAVQALNESHAAMGTRAPATLSYSVGRAVELMRTLVCPSAGQARLRQLSDRELGYLRAAIAPLRPFGLIIDKAALKAEIAARATPPKGLGAAMDALLVDMMREDVTPQRVLARLRDIADMLARLGDRRVQCGDEMNADEVADLTYGLVTEALERLDRRDAGARVRVLCGLAGEPPVDDALQDAWAALQQYAGEQRRDGMARLVRPMVILGFAMRIAAFLRHACSSNGLGVARTGTAPTRTDARLPAAIAGEFGVAWDPAAQAAHPCLQAEHHAEFARRLAGPPDAEALRMLPVMLPLPDGEPSWFYVSAAFARDVVHGPGTSIAVDGVDARGRRVRYRGFDASLHGEARRDAVGGALHALRTLAGDAAPALTALLNGGALDAFRQALEAESGGPPLRRPDGTRALLDPGAMGAAHFLVQRLPEGSYRIETTLVYRDCAGKPAPAAAQPQDRTQALPSPAWVKATYALAATAAGVPDGLAAQVDIRYRFDEGPSPGTPPDGA